MMNHHHGSIVFLSRRVFQFPHQVEQAVSRSKNRAFDDNTNYMPGCLECLQVVAKCF